MNWLKEKCQIGDMIRVKHEDFLYGIYVSEEEIIYFNSERVISTSLEVFKKEGQVEVAQLNYHDHAKRLKSHLVVSSARNRIGETDYENSESFAFECYVGQKLEDKL